MRIITIFIVLEHCPDERLNCKKIVPKMFTNPPPPHYKWAHSLSKTTIDSILLLPFYSLCPQMIFLLDKIFRIKFENNNFKNPF